METTCCGVNAKDFGAIGDGNSHPLSERYASLSDAKASYPDVVSLDDELDWAAIQTALDAIKATPKSNPCVIISPGIYRINKTLQVTRHLYLCHGATLIRKHENPSTDPVILVTNREATLSGGGMVETENDSPRGVVCVAREFSQQPKK